MFPFNRNMGCIEMWHKRHYSNYGISLIETWDVLKFQGIFQKFQFSNV